MWGRRLLFLFAASGLYASDWMEQQEAVWPFQEAEMRTDLDGMIFLRVSKWRNSEDPGSK